MVAKGVTVTVGAVVIVVVVGGISISKQNVITIVNITAMVQGGDGGLGIIVVVGGDDGGEGVGVGRRGEGVHTATTIFADVVVVVAIVLVILFWYEVLLLLLLIVTRVVIL